MYAIVDDDNNIISLSKDSGSICTFNSLEELKKAVKKSYLFKSDREWFVKHYKIAEVNVNITNEQIEFKEKTINTNKITKTGFKKLFKEFLWSTKEGDTFEYGNIIVKYNSYRYLVYIKNIIYIEIEDRKDIEIKNEKPMLYYDDLFHFNFKNWLLDSLYDDIVSKDVVKSDTKTVWYITSDNTIKKCPRNKWY